MTLRRKHIVIFAFSPIYRDARVLRQVEYLEPHFDLTVIGYGPPHKRWEGNPRVRWVSVPEVHPIAEIRRDLKRLRFGKLFARTVSEMRRAIFFATLWSGRLAAPLYDYGYRLRWSGMAALSDGLRGPFDAIHANDWDTIPLAARAAQKHGARLVVDFHEYAPLQWQNRPRWHLNEQMIRTLIRQYAPQMSASITVAKPLAEQYHHDFGLDPIVVMNAPKLVPVPAHEVDPENIRIIHHGLASPVRRPDIMIEAIARADKRYSLHFMFVKDAYVETLRDLAQTIAPGRVTFHDPVAPEEIVARIAEFDVAFNLFAPVTFNYLNALPNKFLESIVAGLASLIGPSPAMAALVDQWNIGLVAPSFDPADLASILNATKAEQWSEMRANAQCAAPHLNAEHEMNKVVQLYAQLLSLNIDASGEHEDVRHHA